MARSPKKRSGRRELADLWFPTILRYVGVGLVIYAAIFDKGRNPALIPAATGMFFFKTVYGGSKE